MKTITLLVLYRCETWSSTLRAEHCLRRLLKGIFGPKWEEELGSYRRLHNDELHNFYALSVIIRVLQSRRMRLTEQLARMVEVRNAYNTLVGKPEGKRDEAEGLGVGGKMVTGWILGNYG
jgi:hypothetical protein